MNHAVLVISASFAAIGASGIYALRTSSMNPGDAVQAAHMLRLGPERIALAVDQVVHGEQMLQRLLGEPELCLSLRQADAQLEGAVAQLAIAEAALASDPTDETLRGELASRSAAVAAAEASIDQVSAELRIVIHQGLAPAVVGRLEHAGNNAARRIPGAFSVLTRTPKQWLKLEQALVSEVRAARAGAAAAPGVVSLLATTRADPDVVAAEARLSNGLASMQAALTALGGPG